VVTICKHGNETCDLINHEKYLEKPKDSVTLKKSDFFVGHRSRCYGRTAALRLIVGPCDEDDNCF
jgi:hypothetical protein